MNSYEHAMTSMNKALKNRKTAETTQNQTSSRSHLIFKFSFLVAKETQGEIVFVDLAGSERYKGDNPKIKKEST